ncbi:MAG: hypothetical protein ACT4N2_02995 [Hyphomicrobium sp.]
MRLAPPPQVNVVRKEEKESKLAEFVRRDLAQRGSGSVGSADKTYFMIARSLDSPVARAVLDQAATAAQAGVQMRIMFMLDDCPPGPRDAILAEHHDMIDARFAADPRLLDAHEFLVLGPTTVWIGDCMRRDPSKRDAYEFHSDEAADAARSAMRSFDRLWRAASPLSTRRVPAEVPAAVVAAGEVVPSGTQSTADAGTRH